MICIKRSEDARDILNLWTYFQVFPVSIFLFLALIQVTLQFSDMHIIQLALTF